MIRFLGYIAQSFTKVMVGSTLAIFVLLNIFFFVLFVSVPYYATILSFSKIPEVHSGDILILLGNIAAGFFTENSFLGVLYTLSIVFLLSLNLAFFIVYFRKVNKGQSFFKTLSTGFGGGILAILGGGCAACGTFVVSYLLSLIGAQWILFALPYGGKELGILGLIMLFLSLGFISKRVLEE